MTTEMTNKANVVDMEEMRKLNYEQAMAEAEKCVDALEGSTLGLEEALQTAERGRAYLAVCEEKLEAAKARLEIREPESTADLV